MKFKIEKIISGLVLFVFWCIFIFNITSFVQLTMDVTNWSMTTRFIFVIFGPIFGLILLLAFISNK